MSTQTRGHVWKYKYKVFGIFSWSTPRLKPLYMNKDLNFFLVVFLTFISGSKTAQISWVGMKGPKWETCWILSMMHTFQPQANFRHGRFLMGTLRLCIVTAYWLAWSHMLLTHPACVVALLCSWKHAIEHSDSEERNIPKSSSCFFLGLK